MWLQVRLVAARTVAQLSASDADRAELRNADVGSVLPRLVGDMEVRQQTVTNHTCLWHCNTLSVTLQGIAKCAVAAMVNLSDDDRMGSSMVKAGVVGAAMEALKVMKPQPLSCPVSC